MGKSLAVLGTIVLTSLFNPASMAQSPHPVGWDIKSNIDFPGQASISFTANILPGWHLYSQFMEEDGPFPTRFSFQPDNNYSLLGKVTETGNAIRFYDDNLEMDITWFSESVTFYQKIILTGAQANVRGKIEFMVCNTQVCLPVEERQFTIEIK